MISRSESDSNSKISRPPSFKVRILISAEAGDTRAIRGSALTAEDGVASILMRIVSVMVDARVVDAPVVEFCACCWRNSRRAAMSTHSWSRNFAALAAMYMGK
ncbi:hypothetical protein B0H10DRAFT_2090713 [Mycena sp. CBHHK59/15]|nr:hypothetical protein B0H10DRAFT_2090713 [Mycena sp. CBHHK59/15]